MKLIFTWTCMELIEYPLLSLDGFSYVIACYCLSVSPGACSFLSASIVCRHLLVSSGFCSYLQLSHGVCYCVSFVSLYMLVCRAFCLMVSVEKGCWLLVSLVVIMVPQEQANVAASPLLQQSRFLEIMWRAMSFFIQSALQFLIMASWFLP